MTGRPYTISPPLQSFPSSVILYYYDNMRRSHILILAKRTSMIFTFFFPRTYYIQVHDVYFLTDVDCSFCIITLYRYQVHDSSSGVAILTQIHHCCQLNQKTKKYLYIQIQNTGFDFFSLPRKKSQ